MLEPGMGRLLSFEGALTPEAVDRLGDELGAALVEANCAPPVVRRAFGLFVELAQNVARHSARREGLAGVGRVEVRQEGSSLMLSTSNAVSADQFAALLAEAERLAGSTPDELQALRRERLRAPARPGGGAGLGLIELVRRSGQPLQVSAGAGHQVVVVARLEAGGGDATAQVRSGQVDVPR